MTTATTTTEEVGRALALVDRGTALLIEARESLTRLLEETLGERPNFNFTWLNAHLWTIDTVRGLLYAPNAMATIMVVAADKGTRFGVFRDLHPDFVFVICSRQALRQVAVLRASTEAPNTKAVKETE